ncbi:MAG: SH3 domain-containing protein [Planctomycetota bacterium]
MNRRFRLPVLFGFIALVIFPALPVRAGPDSGWGHVEDCLQALHWKGPNAERFRELGKAYAAVGETGRAVLCLERARLYDARDGRVLISLKAIRRDAGLEADLDRGWRDYHRYLTSREWAWLALGAVTAFILLLLGRRRLTASALRRLAVASSLALLAALSGVIRHVQDRDRAVVVIAGAPLRDEPDTAANVRMILRSGQIVRQVDPQPTGDFVLVRRSGSRDGWLERDWIEPINP